MRHIHLLMPIMSVICNENNNILNSEITVKEVQEKVTKLKTKKAAGLDSITNEMLKCGRYQLMPAILKILNHVKQVTVSVERSGRVKTCSAKLKCNLNLLNCENGDKK